jgi:O-acetylserine/cysteine efflux transporter
VIGLVAFPPLAAFAYFAEGIDLVPVFGFLGSAIILGEQIPYWKLHAGLLVITGLCINIYDIRRHSIAAKKIGTPRS